LTNPNLPHYQEVDLLFVVDPKLDAQAVSEAAKMGIPVMALVDTDTPYQYIDFMIPCNNKGRKSLALIFWILARQVLRERGELKPDQDLPVPPEEFETRLVKPKRESLIIVTKLGLMRVRKPAVAGISTNLTKRSSYNAWSGR
jgi:SSU ribosomal protein S2P